MSCVSSHRFCYRANRALVSCVSCMMRQNKCIHTHKIDTHTYVRALAQYSAVVEAASLTQRSECMVHCYWHSGGSTTEHVALLQSTLHCLPSALFHHTATEHVCIETLASNFRTALLQSRQHSMCSLLLSAPWACLDHGPGY